MQAAESGHLVFSTLHTIDAAETIGRMIEFFPPAKQQQIRSILAGTLRGVVSQRLLPRTDGGRVPAVEVMVTNARIQDLIRENRPDEITDAIAAGEFFQMQTFAQSLIALVIRGEVDREVAANAATNRHDFLVALEQAEKNSMRRDRSRRTATHHERLRRRRPKPGSEPLVARPPLASRSPCAHHPFGGIPSSSARLPMVSLWTSVDCRVACLRLLRARAARPAREAGFTLIETLMARRSSPWSRRARGRPHLLDRGALDCERANRAEQCANDQVEQIRRMDYDRRRPSSAATRRAS